MIDFALVNTTRTVSSGSYSVQVTNPDLGMDNNYNLIFVQNADCINQMIVCALRLFISEYEYNNSLGISWVIAMEYGYTQIPLLQFQVQQTINSLNNYINDPNLKILSVQQTNFTFTTDRVLTLTTQVTLANGIALGIDING